MKNILLFFALLIALNCSGKKQTDSPTAKIQTVSINLPSMVCNTCAKTITKAVYRVEGVKDVDINVKKKVAQVQFIPMQTNLETIERAINETGYDANDKKRNQEAYEKLDACCKIDG